MNVFDIETYKDNTKVIPYCLIMIFNKKKYIFYYNEEKNIIIDFLEKIIELSDNSKKNVIFCHNINFDGLIIAEILLKSGIHFNWFIKKMNIYWIRILYMNILIELRCSYKIIPISIEKLGELIGNEKKTFPYLFVNKKTLNYIGNVPNREYFDSESDFLSFKNIKIFDMKKITIEYCLKDVEILEQVLNNIVSIISEYGKYLRNSYTFSSLSYKIYKKKYDYHKIIDIKLSKEEYNYISNSYFGGRTEVFGNPTNNKIIHYFDFSGMYGQCMMELFPIGRGKFDYTNKDYSRIGFHTVKVKSNIQFPLLPVHSNNKLIFPNGEFIGTFWYEEIDLFIKNKGLVIECYSSYLYENSDFIFQKFVEEFKFIRNKGIYYKIFGKSITNGLYGTFALKEDDYITILTTSEEEFESIKKFTNVKKWIKFDKYIVVEVIRDYLSKKYYDKDNMEESRNLAYSSIIASKARIKLNKEIINLIKNDWDIYYYDTDSIFAGHDQNWLNKSIGEVTWSNIYDDAVFISPKFYHLKNEDMKSKGVKNSKYTFDDTKNKFYNNEKIIFENQLQFNKSNYILEQKYISKEINTNFYDKRIFTNDKKKTKSIII